MISKTLSIVAGFVVWSILWFAVNAGLSTIGLLPAPGATIDTSLVLLVLLGASLLASLAAGFSTSWLARAVDHGAALLLGFVLLAVGVIVQAQYWSQMPVWYHLSFLVLLVPACVAGSWLKSKISLKRSPASRQQ